ncbi:hypothetical protein [Candidatus Poriferisodalis sp.]|uniref:hypothetical protein n=1 Tax=Candidatus Poriferisodalis sp. TaxID=3101277 RepID=UPI003B014C03
MIGNDWFGYVVMAMIWRAVLWLTGWPWWVLSAPAAVIAGCILMYAWAKRRPEAAGGG